MQTGSRTPRVSFGVPVYNEEKSIQRCLDSLLAQDFEDFEVVVCDNASTDQTRDVVAGYVARDPRISLFTSPTNLGLIHNFNRVFQLTHGELFRWVGADDWLEPGYASRSVAALDADPGAIVATADFALHDEQGGTRIASFEGERLESESPDRRFARALWFYMGIVRYEPLYSLMRRAVLARTSVIRNVVNNDLMLIAELSLIGRFAHVPELLFHRRWRPAPNDAFMLELLTGASGGSPGASFLSRLRVLMSIVRAGDLSRLQRASCYAAIARFSSKELAQISVARANHLRRQRLRLTRERLRELLGGRGA
jgi:glycosyltransferase involved in cell wall biosynthesis